MSAIFESRSPYTNEKIAEYSALSNSLIESALNNSQKSFFNWQNISFKDRQKYLVILAEKIEYYNVNGAKLASLEMGKAISEARAELSKCALLCRHYSQVLIEEENDVKTEYQKSYVAIKPLGTILGIMPWNFPYWQVFRFAVPTLLMGNSVIIKHAPNVLGCAELIQKIFNEAGFPEYLFQNLIIDHDHAGKIIADSRVKAVSLTGSTRAGQEVASIAGKNLKKCVLELGGSDPYIVFKDADIELAAESCVQSRLINSGQSCVAAKRFIVDQSIKEKFTEIIAQQMNKRKLGDPLDLNTNLGPLARNDLRENLHRQVTESVKQGAKLICGGDFSKLKGWAYPPTVLTDVMPNMTAFNEELFGPVASIISFNTEDEAIKLANHTIYGLGAAIFSKDINKAEKIAKSKINSGMVFINTFVKSDPRLPFGGIKSSGYGRELGSFGLHEFTNAKTIVVQ